MQTQEIKPKRGGNALKHLGVIRISKQDILPTIKYFAQLTSIPLDDLYLIGSGGKTQSSGDIDLAIDKSKYDFKLTYQKIGSLLQPEYCSSNAGTHTAFFAIPICGDIDRGLVQIDLMFVDDIRWALFAYHSEGDKSNYKSAIRAILLSAVAASIEDGTTAFVYDDKTGLLVARSSYTFDLTKGLRRVYQYRKFKQDGIHYANNMSSVNPSELQRMYPNLNIIESFPVTDPVQALNIMFNGRHVLPNDVKSVENIISLINIFFSPSRRVKTYRYASLRCAPLKDKMKIPEELQNYSTETL